MTWEDSAGEPVYEPGPMHAASGKKLVCSGCLRREGDPYVVGDRCPCGGEFRQTGSGGLWPDVAEAWRILDESVANCQVLADLCEGLDDPMGDTVLGMVLALTDRLAKAMGLLGESNVGTCEQREAERAG